MTEGSLGYILQQNLLNQLRKKDVRRYVVTVVTQVLVDGHDPAFSNPTKPIGPFLAREEAERRRDQLGWNIKEDAGRGWRRLVPSPQPQRVIQRHMIRDAVRAGHIVIACGGGGIPIKKDAHDQYVGVEAVIDKDHASGLLARDIEADLLIMATDAPAVFVGFGTENARAIELASPDALLPEYQKEFAEGSMLPKVVAACDFARATGRVAAIGALADIEAMLEGTAGTRVSTEADGIRFATAPA